MKNEQDCKPVGLTASAGYQIGVRRTLPLSQEQAWELLTSPEMTALWLGTLPSLFPEAGQTYETAEGTCGEMRIVKPLHQLRMTWQKTGWVQPSTLQIRVLPSAANKTTISFHQEKLADQLVREEMKLRWEEVLRVMIDKANSLKEETE